MIFYTGNPKKTTKNLFKKINNFSNISKLYEFAADRILFYGDLRPTVEEEDHLWCFVYEMSIGLVYNNTDFLKIALDKKKLTFTTYIKLLRLLAKEGKPRPDKKLSDDLYRINTMPNIVGFYGLRNEMIKKRHVEIIFSNIEEVKKFLEDSKGYNSTKKNQEFFAVVTTLDPEYEMKIIQLIIENDVKKDEFIDIKYDRDLFTKSWLISVISIDNYDFPCFDEEKDKKKFDEILLLILKIFLHEKVFKNESFKRLPEFFKNMVVIEQIRSVYGKADVLPELGLDKEKLKKEADKFFAELKKIAKNGGKPSDYYAGEYFESDKISDPESYLTSLVFQTAVSFVQDSFGAWKAVKPMLAIFRNLKEQAYSIGMKSSDYGCYPWDFVSIRLTELLGALDLDKDNVEEKEKVCEEWFNHIAKQLSSADETEVKKREENPETVPEKFKDGYDIKTVEAHPLWREVFCNAAKELGVHPIFEKYKVFNYLKKNDIDREVRAAAAETFDSIEEISGKFKSGSKKLLKALWCYKIAHLISLDIDVEDADIPSIELTSNYKKYFEVPKLPNVKSQS